MGKSNGNNPNFPNNAPIKGNFTYEERVLTESSETDKEQVFKIVFYTKPFLFLFQLLNFYEIVRVFHLIRGDQCNNSPMKIVYMTLKKSSNWLDLQHLINIFNQKNGLSNLIYLSVIKFFRNCLTFVNTFHKHINCTGSSSRSILLPQHYDYH